MSLPAETVRAATRHLRRADPVMRDLLAQAGPITLTLQRDRFQTLVRSIVGQQISTSAARSIRARLEQLVAPARLSPESLVDLDVETLRTAGLSQQKANYILDLAQRTHSGALRLNQLGRLSDEAIIAQLTTVKGIGRWTAQMFLMFSLGRPDVFPHDDLGIRAALRNLYGLADLPDKATSQKIAEPWRPYSTIASWYCWRSLELRPSKSK